MIAAAIILALTCGAAYAWLIWHEQDCVRCGGPGASPINGLCVVCAVDINLQAP